MLCPYEHEVGDPPNRINCPIRDLTVEVLTCMCEIEMMSPQDDPQTEYVTRWWINREMEQRETVSDPFRATRPTIQMEDEVP